MSLRRSWCVCIRLATEANWLAEASWVAAVKPRLSPYQLLWAATGNCSHLEEVFDEAEQCQRRIPAGQCNTMCSTSGLWHVLPAVALFILMLKIKTQWNNLDKSTLLFWIKKIFYCFIQIRSLFPPSTSWQFQCQSSDKWINKCFLLSKMDFGSDWRSIAWYLSKDRLTCRYKSYLLMVFYPVPL